MKIDELYNSGMSATKIAEQLKISRYKVIKKLRVLGVNVYNKQNEIKWDIKKAEKLYKKGATLSEIAKKYKVSVSVVSIRFKKLNIKVVNYQNRLRFDNTVFNKIDTEEKAYWLGFIYADGYVGKNANNFELSLALKDVKHLKKFAKFMKHDKNVKLDSFRCRFQVYNKHLKEVLITLGVTPKKSLTLKFPNHKQIPKQLMHHFIRGYFDGDGCIITKETSEKNLGIYILGTKEFLNGIIKEVKIQRKIYNKKNNKAKVISFAVENSEKFCDYIYKDANIFLERKFKLYTNYLKTIKQ